MRKIMNKNCLWQKISLLGAISFTTIMIVSPYRSVAERDNSDWSYGGASNPSRWHELEPEFESCKLGSVQSPIDISNYEEGESAEIEFNYQPSQVEVVDNNRTIQVNYQPGNTVRIDGEEYKLLQFHFHTPSEHTIDNEASAIEVHFVHQNQAGELAVVGVMMNSGAENPTIASIWSAISDDNQVDNAKSITIDAASLLPTERTYLSYTGSLTTPPCSEDVSWNLLLEPIELSAEQIATFENLYPYNARPVQSLNGRSVRLHSE